MLHTKNVWCSETCDIIIVVGWDFGFTEIVTVTLQWKLINQYIMNNATTTTLGTLNSRNRPVEFISWQVKQIEAHRNGIRKKKFSKAIIIVGIIIAAEVKLQSGGNIMQNITYIFQGGNKFRRRNLQTLYPHKTRANTTSTFKRRIAHDQQQEEGVEDCGSVHWNWLSHWNNEKKKLKLISERICETLGSLCIFKG